MAGKTGSKRYCFACGAQSASGLILLLFVLHALGILAIAATADAAQNDQGQLEIRLKDHREAIGDFSRVTLKLDKVSISSKPGFKFWQAGWQDLTPAVATVDLTKYVGKQTITIFKGPLATGSFDAFHLKLAGVEGILKKNKKPAQIKNTVGAIKLPFSIAAASTTLIVLDLAVEDVSDHPPLTYQLGIGGWELYSNGKLVDKVPPG
jgi:hypothetical protein